jgi:hypothetical protein
VLVVVEVLVAAAGSWKRTFWISSYKNLLDPKDTKTSQDSKDTKTF